eukprot:12171990-Alexandrium_andersonii.AAC.1
MHSRRLQPHIFTNECSAAYPAQDVDNLVFKPQAWDVAEYPGEYDFKTITFNAADLGIPSSRPRR